MPFDLLSAVDFPATREQGHSATPRESPSDLLLAMDSSAATEQGHFTPRNWCPLTSFQLWIFLQQENKVTHLPWWSHPLRPIFCSSWYNPNGWLGVKHQVTYQSSSNGFSCYKRTRSLKHIGNNKHLPPPFSSEFSRYNKRTRSLNHVMGIMPFDPLSAVNSSAARELGHSTTPRESVTPLWPSLLEWSLLLQKN